MELRMERNEIIKRLKSGLLHKHFPCRVCREAVDAAISELSEDNIAPDFFIINWDLS